MKLIKRIWPLLAFVFLGLSGCVTTPDSVGSVSKVVHLGPDVNLTGQASVGAIMIQAQRGQHFTAYQLDETVKTSLLGNSCTVSPQTFTRIRQDDEFYYAISNKDYVKPSPLNWQQKDYLRTCPCGVKFSKKDTKIESVVFEHKNGSIDKMGPISIDGISRPILKPVSEVNVFAQSFLRKTLKFNSFADGFLSLRYMEERGRPGGHLPPAETERMYDFDLQTSKTINVQGAKIEITDARPDKLVYKIIRQLNVEQ